MTLDERINNDLDNLYNSGIFTCIQQFRKCKIKMAEQLSIDLFGTPNKFSIHGLPGYYTGKRDAKIVMVMLNPGSNVISHDNPFVTEIALERSMKELGITNPSSIDDFVNLFVQGISNYGEIDKNRKDNFDIKQAAFLKAWDKDKSEIEIPDEFPGMLKDIPSKPTKNQKTELDNLLKKVKQNVLMQKLQLELVPYASREFMTIRPDKYRYLFPYVETLFDEIFSHERKYVIFCSSFFDKLFRMYNDDMDYPGKIHFYENDSRKGKPLFPNGRKAYCTPIKITYNNGKAMTFIHAVIAQTFPNKALPNAYDIMQEYGKFCYDEFIKFKNNNP